MCLRSLSLRNYFFHSSTDLQTDRQRKEEKALTPVVLNWIVLLRQRKHINTHPDVLSSSTSSLLIVLTHPVSVSDSQLKGSLGAHSSFPFIPLLKKSCVFSQYSLRALCLSLLRNAIEWNWLLKQEIKRTKARITGDEDEGRERREQQEEQQKEERRR